MSEYRGPDLLRIYQEQEEQKKKALNIKSILATVPHKNEKPVKIFDSIEKINKRMKALEEGITHNSKIKNKVSPIKKDTSSGDWATKLEKHFGFKISPKVKEFLEPYKGASWVFGPAVSKELKDDLYLHGFMYETLYLDKYNSTNYEWNSNPLLHKTLTLDMIEKMQDEINVHEMIKPYFGNKRLWIPFGGICLGLKEYHNCFYFVNVETGQLLTNVLWDAKEYAIFGTVDNFPEMCKIIAETYRPIIKDLQASTSYGIFGFADSDSEINFKSLTIKTEDGRANFNAISKWFETVWCEEYDCSVTWVVDQSGKIWFDFIKQYLSDDEVDKLMEKYKHLNPSWGGDWAPLFYELANGEVYFTILDYYKTWQNSDFYGAITMKIHDKYFIIWLDSYETCKKIMMSNTPDLDKALTNWMNGVVKESMVYDDIFNSSFFMEAEDDNAPDDKETPVEEKETAQKEDNNASTDEKESDNVGDDEDVDLSEFGQHGGDDLPNNEYDQKEVETLNALIASEASAISEYAEAAKTSKEEILQRLYSDISDEERFHLEQLMFAKAELTGEKYVPRDAAVKREYEELLELGMDEEDAMATAIDKTGLRAQVTVEEPNPEELQKDIETLEYAMMNAELLLTIMEQAEENQDQNLINQISTFTESFYMETVANSRTYPREYYKPFNPFDALIQLFIGTLNLVAKLIHAMKGYWRAGRMRMDQRFAWFRRHGIEGLLSKGVTLYTWDDGRHQFDIDEMANLVNILFGLTKQCGLDAKFDNKIMQPFTSIRRPFYCKNQQYNRDYDTREAVNAISGINMMPSKLVIQSEQDEAELINIFFGFTNEMMPKFRQIDSDPFIWKSRNIYNRIYYLMEATEWYGEKTKSVLDQYRLLEGDQGSIYFNNHASYKKNLENMKLVVKGYNKLVKALSHDVSVLNSFDQYFTRQQQEEYDQKHGPNSGGRSAVITQRNANGAAVDVSTDYRDPKIPMQRRTPMGMKRNP